MSENPRDVPGRALGYEAKRDVVDKILGAWMVEPSLRLGQLIANSLNMRRPGYWRPTAGLFYVEDKELVQKVTEFVTKEK